MTEGIEPIHQSIRYSILTCCWVDPHRASEKTVEHSAPPQSSSSPGTAHLSNGIAIQLAVEAPNLGIVVSCSLPHTQCSHKFCRPCLYPTVSTPDCCHQYLNSHHQIILLDTKTPPHSPLSFHSWSPRVSSPSRSQSAFLHVQIR